MESVANENLRPNAPSGLSNSRLLRSKIRLFDGALCVEADRFWGHPEFPAVYRTYLRHSYSIVRATVPLMRAAIESLKKPKFSGDIFTPPLIRYLEQHAEEETGHDEWILDDAEAIGMARDEVRDWRPGQNSSHIVGAQYYWIHHYHPISLLGYIAVMEGNPASTEFFEDVARRNNLPNAAISSFLYHSKIDPTHRDDLDRLLDSLPLGPNETELIGLSALRTVQYVTTTLREVNESCQGS